MPWKYRGSGGIVSPFLTPALDGGERSASRPGCFTSGEIVTGTHWIGGWVGPRACLHTMEKRKILRICLELNPGRTARSQSLYRLSYLDFRTHGYIFFILLNKDIHLLNQFYNQQLIWSLRWKHIIKLAASSPSPSRKSVTKIFLHCMPFSLDRRPVIIIAIVVKSSYTVVQYYTMFLGDLWGCLF
jgi:hypothetical protein